MRIPNSRNPAIATSLNPMDCDVSKPERRYQQKPLRCDKPESTNRYQS
jgi:hypothetical protein